MAQQGMPNPVELLQKVVVSTKKVVAGVKQDQLNDPTPCDQWTVKDVINHLIGGAEEVHGGLTASTQINPGGNRSSLESETDVAKLSQGYNKAIDRLLESAQDPNCLSKSIVTPLGDLTGGQILTGMFMDNLVHGWDLAKATGQNAVTDPELTEICYQCFFPDFADLGRSIGVVGPPVPVSENASTQEKLLAYMGRQP